MRYISFEKGIFPFLHEIVIEIQEIIVKLLSIATIPFSLSLFLLLAHRQFYRFLFKYILAKHTRFLLLFRNLSRKFRMTINILRLKKKKRNRNRHESAYIDITSIFLRNNYIYIVNFYIVQSKYNSKNFANESQNDLHLKSYLIIIIIITPLLLLNKIEYFSFE